MEHQLYIRFRGRILGPYDKPKLQALVRRGQLSQMHELSPDSINWVPAAKYPEIFVSEEISQTVPREQSAKAAHQAVERDQEYPRAEKRWWYRKDESQVGPIEESILRQSLASGTLSLDDFVWTEGLPQWLPAREIPELAAVQSSAPRQQDYPSLTPAAGDKNHDLSLTLCRAAASSRPWVLFLSTTAFVAAALGLIGGATQAFVGARLANSNLVACGLFTIIGGLIYGVGGYLLMDYARQLGEVRAYRAQAALENALDRIRTFWIFATINVIVWLAFIIIAVIVVFSVGITWPIP